MTFYCLVCDGAPLLLCYKKENELKVDIKTAYSVIHHKSATDVLTLLELLADYRER